MDIDRAALEQRMAAYFDPAVSHEEMANICAIAVKNASRFEAKPTREYLRKRGITPERHSTLLLSSFDLRWLYWEPETKLLEKSELNMLASGQRERVVVCSAAKPKRFRSTGDFIATLFVASD